MSEDNNAAAALLEALPGLTAPIEGGDFLESIGKALSIKEITPENPATTQADLKTPTNGEVVKIDPLAKETPAAADDGPPGKGSEAAKTGWMQLKEAKNEAISRAEALQKEIDARNTELAEARREAQEAKDQLVDLPSLKEKAQIAEEAERELKVARVESSQEWKNVIAKPLGAISEALDAIAEANEIPVRSLAEAISEADPKEQRRLMNELIPSLSELDRLKLVQMAGDYKIIDAKREEMRTHAAEAQKELEERRSREEAKFHKETRSRYESQVTATIDHLKKSIPVDLAEGETLDGVFATVARDAASIDFSKLTPDIQARAASFSLLLPRVVEQLKQTQAKLKEAEARVTSMHKTTPSVAQGTPSAPADSVDFLTSMSRRIHAARG